MVTDEITHSSNDTNKAPVFLSDDDMTLENVSIKSREEVSLSDDTESITLSTDGHTKDMIEEEQEDIHPDSDDDDDLEPNKTNQELLQEEEGQSVDRDEGDSEEEEEGDRPSYKRMDLKGESESDKDLIIYSLNESLQIHKEIVERIQHEKDDLEDKYERERVFEKLELQRETLEMEGKQSEKKQELGKLETIYQALLNEVEAKKQDYKRMENKFQDYVKSIRATEDDLNSIRPEINHLLGQISNLCMSIKSKLPDRRLATEAFLKLWPEKVDLIKSHFNSVQEENEEDEQEQEGEDDFVLDSTVLSLMTEKMMIEIIIEDILKTPIHPGVPVNDAFGKLYTWVDKRNTSWAARMKQQISAFVIRQAPTEEQEALDKAKDDIINKMMTQLDCIYPDLVEDGKIQKKITSIVHKAIKLNLSIKCQENPIEILPVEEGVATFDETVMTSATEQQDATLVSLMVSPLFVAKDNTDENHGFVIPAKVYCT